MEESCPDILVLCVCRRERHRSIATKELIFNYLNRNKDKYRIKVEYAKPPVFPSHVCRYHCVECKHYAGMAQKYHNMVKDAEMTFKEKFEN
eukprot:5414071-Karenia_brevis.AAC.1